MAALTPGPVKLVAGVLAAPGPGRLEAVRQRLEAAWGPADLASPVWPFPWTDYYEPEMGPGLQRQLLSFARPADPGGLAAWKRRAIELEAEFAAGAGPGPARPVNLDPGWLDEARLVLATTKDRAHRVYLGQGIYGEVTLLWAKGEYRAQPWTYPDYASKEYREFFARVRARLRSD